MDRKEKESGFLAVATALKSAELFSKGPTEGRAKVLIEDLEHFLKKFWLYNYRGWSESV